MNRVPRFTTLFGAALLALIASPVTGWALDIDFDVSQSSFTLGEATPVEATLQLTNTQASVATGIELQGSLPAGFAVTGLEISPTMLMGESYASDGSYLDYVSTENGETLKRLPITLQGAPASTQACSVYGLDVHPVSGEVYALVGLQASGDTCYWTSTVRDLFRIKFESDQVLATWIGSPPVVLSGLVFSPTGQLFGIGGNLAVNKAGLYSLNTQNAGLAAFATSPIPESTELWNNSATVAANFTDGLMYTFYRCQVATTDPATKAQTAPVSVASCDANRWGAASYLGDDQFIVHRASGNSRVYLFLKDEGGWTQTRLDDRDNSNLRSGFVASAGGAGAGECTTSDEAFHCTIGRMVSSGIYQVKLTGTYTPTKIGTQTIDIAISSSRGSSSAKTVFQVVGADLAAFAHADVRQVNVGDDVTWTVELENLGTASASNSSVAIQLPDHQTYVGNTATQGSCTLAGETLTCNAGTLGSRNIARFTIDTTANAEGLSVIEAVASTTSAEARTDNNSAKAQVVVGPGVDIAVQAQRAAGDDGDDPALTMPGQAVSLVFQVQNHGPDDASSVMLRHLLPNGFTLAGADTDAGSCNIVENLLECSLGTMSAEGSATIELAPTASLGGTYPLEVTAWAVDALEVNPSDNRGRLEVDVLPPSLEVALGSASPGSDAAVTGRNAPVAQVVLRHGGESEQDLSVRRLTLEGTFTGLPFESTRVLVVHDTAATGRFNAEDRMLGQADIRFDGNAAHVRITGRGIEVPAGEELTILFVTRDDLSEGADMAGMLGGSWTQPGPMATAGLMVVLVLSIAATLPRRRKLVFATAALGLGLSLAMAGCGDGEGIAEGKIQITLTGVDAVLAEGRGPAAPIEGLPLEGPVLEVRK